jgi:hypothetical protein
MSNRNAPSTKSLSQWLNVATDKLCSQAKEKIATEIESHVADAVEKHCENGNSESEARWIALSELGDPAVSGRKFREIYLTENEFKTVVSTLKGVCGPRWLQWRLIICFVILGFIIPPFVLGGSAGFAAGTIGVSYVVIYGALSLLVRSRMKREKFSPATIRYILMTIIFQTGLIWMGIGGWGLGLIAILIGCFRLRILRKLSNMKYRWWETSENGRIARPGERF